MKQIGQRLLYWIGQFLLLGNDSLFWDHFEMNDALRGINT